MQSRILSVAVLTALVVTVESSSANPLTGNERFQSATPTDQTTPTLPPANRVTPVRQVDPIQRSDNASLLIPQTATDNLRPTVSNRVDSTSSMGKIITSSVSKLVLDSATRPGADNNASGERERNPLLEALRWRGANSSQVGVPAELWCADFMNFILGQTGQSGTGSRAARSFLKYGKPLDGPRVGAIVVLTRSGGHANAGHVGIVRGTDGEGNPVVISGNHGRRVAESVYKKEKVIGYFMPPSMERASAATMSAAVNSVIAQGR